MNQQQTRPADPAPVNPGRRRLFRGVGGGAGVLMAVSAKTALGATVCKSPSAMMSGNTSPRPGDGTTCSGGRSPGFWKVPQHFSYWTKAGATPPTFNVPVKECATGTGNLSMADVATTGTLLAGAGFTNLPDPSVSMWAVLAFPTSYADGQLLRHLAAAWLNAGYFTESSAKYPMTQAQVIEIYKQLKTTGVYCPTSFLNCSDPWTPAEVISYIEQLYDFNSEVEPNLCKGA